MPAWTTVPSTLVVQGHSRQVNHDRRHRRPVDENTLLTHRRKVDLSQEAMRIFRSLEMEMQLRGLVNQRGVEY